MTKQQLALLYFPQSTPRTAVNHLMAWTHRCKPLMHELQETGYNIKSKTLTPRQVNIIIRHLGDP